MPCIEKLVAALAATAAVGLSMTGVTDTNARAKDDSAMHCEIRVMQQDGGVALNGVVYASAKIDGEYRLNVSKSGGDGSANIDQSGDFSAAPGSPGRLGTVMLGANGGTYDARLTVTAGGRSIDCTETVRGAL